MTVFVFAMPFEAGAIRRFPERTTLWILNAAGPACTEALELRLKSHPPPREIISIGLAGALNPEIAPAEIFLGSESDPQFLEKFSPDYPTARICTLDSVATTAEDKARLRSQTHADLCDMESARVHAVCTAHGISFGAVRAVSDHAAFSLPVPPKILVNPETGQPDLPALLGTLISDPAKIPAFLQMIRHASTARNALARFVARYVS